ncbi:DUF4333 domain-containing protein [Actinomadura sp. WMMB 499]|uniref:DUF4333 domain-containing protein n=1 Tax=Actinomadura sp. WMMB 499 TaxID=1219491 RepID=UPI0012479162|nr:DUF4333 domain-containing protein [Actinomadura sp. WMMB 499]QFG22237.1 DUF4333 domain-containing protein [Actinomadura sp. WMMB 499]
MAQPTRGRTARRAAAGLLVALFAAGCSMSVGGSKAVSKDEIVEQATAALGQQIGRAPDAITCEDDLKAEVGATVRCELTVDGRKQGMTVTATAVDDDRVKMDFKVDDAPGAAGSTPPAPSSPATGAPGSGGGTQTVNRAEVARQGKAALTAQVGRAPDAFICRQDLPARVGATVRCQLAADGKQYGVTATVTSVAGGKARMNFKVDDAPNGS